LYYPCQTDRRRHAVSLLQPELRKPTLRPGAAGGGGGAAPRGNVGGQRGAFVPNPSARSPECLDQFRFVGRLMAGCVTIDEPMNVARRPADGPTQMTQTPWP